MRLLEILEAPDDDPIHHEPGSFDYKGVHQGWVCVINRVHWLV